MIFLLGGSLILNSKNKCLGEAHQLAELNSAYLNLEIHMLQMLLYEDSINELL